MKEILTLNVSINSKTDVDMAPRSTGRTSKPDKPVIDKTMAFEHRDGQHHQEE